MTSIASKALALISGLALTASSITGCAIAPFTNAKSVSSVECKDLSSPEWSNFSYTNTAWKKNSSMFSGFGTFRCEGDVTVTFSVSPLGNNLVAGETVISFGKDQLPIASFPKISKSILKATQLLPVNGRSIAVSANETFQPLVKLTQSDFGLTYGNEPVEIKMKMSAEGKKSVVFKKVLRLATAKDSSSPAQTNLQTSRL